MSDASVLKEYLISLGFKIDDSSYKKFKSGLDGITVKAVALGEVIADVAEKVAQGVVKMAQSLDTLYFTSRRVGDSAENISAFGFAISQMGGSAESATASLESLASKMRFTPGLINAMQGWGIKTTDAKGALLGTSDLLVSAGRFWAAQNKRLGMAAGQAIGLRQAQLMGIDEKTFLQLSTNPDQLDAEMKKYREMADALGYNVDAAHRFETSMRDLKAEFGLFASVVGLKVMDTLQELIDKFDKLFPGVMKFLGTKQGIQLFADAVIASLGLLAIATLAATWPWLLLAAAITGAIYAFQHWNEIRHPNAKNKAETVKALSDIWDALKSGQIGKAIGIAKDRVSKVLGDIANGSGDNGADSGPPGHGAAAPRSGADPSLNPNARSVRNNNPGNLMRNGHYRSFATLEEGTAAMKAQLLRDYFKHGLNTASSLINDSRWGWANENAPGNTHAATMNYIAAIARALGVGANDKINLADPKTLATVMAAMARFEAGSAHPLLGRHTKHVSIHHKTTIHVDGSKDPKATGAAVSAAQERVWANALRGAKSVLN